MAERVPRCIVTSIVFLALSVPMQNLSASDSGVTRVALIGYKGSTKWDIGVSNRNATARLHQIKKVNKGPVNRTQQWSIKQLLLEPHIHGPLTLGLVRVELT